MTNKEWIKSALAHEETDAVPYNFLFCPTARKRLEEYYGVDSIDKAFNMPIRMPGPVSIKPLYADPAIYGDRITDEHGVVWTTNSIDRGSPIGPCLPEPDLSHYSFPDPTKAYRFEGVAETCEKYRDHYLVMWVGDLWERATFMRGMEDLLLDLALNPEFVGKLLEGLADNIITTMEILFKTCEFDCIAMSDDYGSQKGMLMSPTSWREIIKPHLARIYACGKAHGKAVFHHTCGHVVPIIPDMIDIGLDILHPIQPETMDIFMLKQEFGKELTFCGGVNTQDLLPFGSPEAVRDEVRHLKRTMGAGGGYILEPGITIQDDVPLKNIVAMVEEAQVRS